MAIGSMTTNSTVDMIDKTLKTENAPADAAATGAALDKKANKDIVLDPDGNAIFYSKAEVEAKIKEILAAQREEDLARIKFWASDDPTSPASFIGGTWERIEDCTIWGASSIHPAGTKLEAGLPNITGKTYLRGVKDQSGTRSGIVWDKTDGALTSVAQTTEDHSSNSIISSNDNYNENESGMIKIDASGSNPIYGASTTVQPPAYCTHIWRRVA